ncbi:L,D-transpeptidase family protein [Acidipropionibacterium acidipropionici]|uniref:L,D-transpeptidase family protein n=1 Tax=Acidipropionibacterium acidipropionici TaxID=1748 RepID=UPI001586DC29|nr:SH3 domain-containing protein [Acidipropionibacterium acidipropionici]
MRTNRAAKVAPILISGALAMALASCASSDNAGGGTSATPAPASSAPSLASTPSTSTPSTPSPSASTPTPTPSAAAFKAHAAYVTTDSLNLRATASADSEVLGQLAAGSKVIVSGAPTAGFTPVQYQGISAFVTAKWLSTTKPATQVSVTTKYATTALNVREQAGTGSAVLKTLAAGDKVSATGTTVEGWTAVIYNGQEAWVKTQYLSSKKPATPTPGTSGADPVSLDSRCKTGLVICISKTDRQLRLVQDGKVLISLDARFGSEEGPTREGTFSIEWRNKDWVSTIYGSKMPYAMFFSGGEAIHYSSDFAARGYDGNSHGCVNIRSWSGIQYVWDHAPVGTKVVVYS